MVAMRNVIKSISKNKKGKIPVDYPQTKNEI